ncbi:MAG: glycosyltransferase [Acidobacteriota bacterium]
MSQDYLCRQPGYSMTPFEDGLLLRARDTRTRLRLNRTATLAWLLCDGTLEAEELVARLQQLHPDHAEAVTVEIPGLLNQLLESGHLRTRPVAWERPLLRVSFGGFWQDFEPGDNYFTWMLSYRYDVLIVPPSSIPDLDFFGPHCDVESVAWDHERSLGISFGSASRQPRHSGQGRTVDLTLRWDGEDGDGHLHLPTWALVVDWTRDLEGVPDRDRLTRFSPHNFGERFLSALEQRAAHQPGGREAEPSRAAGPTRPPAELDDLQPGPAADGPRLTVGMATYDDYDGVYFTVQALVLNQPEIAADLEILIVDNHPEGPAAEALAGLAAGVPGARYLAFSEIRSTAVRDVIFREARAPIVLCMDSHVLLSPGSLLRLTEYFEARADCAELVHGPLLYDDHRTLSTHFEPVWSAGMYGVWATDDRGLDVDAPPFEIPMQGLGLFACRTEAWPGLNPRLRGFGGEEGYLHEKFRRSGGRALCLPFLRWIHRFQRPGGIPFANLWEDRIRNYLIVHHELGLPITGLESHFRSFLGDALYQRTEAAVLAEMASPWWAFDAIYTLGRAPDLSGGNSPDAFAKAASATGLDKLLRQPPDPAGKPLPQEPDLRFAYRLRQLSERAARLDFASTLILDAEATRLAELAELLPDATQALDEALAVSIYPPQPAPLAATDLPWAIAISRRGLKRICDQLPRKPAALDEWLRSHGGTLSRALESLGDVVSLPHVGDNRTPIDDQDTVNRTRGQDT